MQRLSLDFAAFMPRFAAPCSPLRHIAPESPSAAKRDHNPGATEALASRPGSPGFQLFKDWTPTFVGKMHPSGMSPLYSRHH